MVAACFAAALLFGVGRAQAAKPGAQASAPDPNAQYAGSETCQTCHEDIYNAFQKNPHFAVEKGSTKAAWKAKACESCHGPGQKHSESTSAEDIVNPAKATVTAGTRICMTCHQNEKTNSGRIESAHAKNSVRCSGCHSIHGESQGWAPRQAAKINEQCSSCHVAEWAQFQRPHKHPLPEGAMSCVSCHNPHGSVLPRMVRTANANEPGCMKCHGDKRGPFVFEHAPVRLEGCTTCHEAHGSANPRMLIRQEQRYVCLECHANIAMGKTIGGVPPAFHDLRSSRFQNCTICHVKIHGSNVNEALLR